MHRSAIAAGKTAFTAVVWFYALLALTLAALYGLTCRETWVKPSDAERKQLKKGRMLAGRTLP